MRAVLRPADRRRKSVVSRAALYLALPALAAFLGGAVPAAGGERSLSLSERIDAQRRIEEIYWERRIWPEANPGPKPSLSSILPESARQARVVDDLRKSSALERLWHRPLTSDQLQAEVERMARETRDPETLRALFTALGNDPERVREGLARPILADRLIRGWYAFDRRFHEGPFRLAGAGRGEDEVRRIDYRPEAPAAGRSRSRGSDPAGRVRMLAPGDWDALQRRFDASSSERVEETEEAFVRRSVDSRSSGRIVVTERLWRKRPFDSWWSEVAPTLPVEEGTLAKGSSATTESSLGALPEALAGGCSPDTWLPDGGLSGLDALTGQTAVWTGTEMIVWGGTNGAPTATGFRYTPATDTWVKVAVSGAPAPRSDHTAVWTGTEMIVWGGRSAVGSTLDTGGRYDPAAGTWTATNLTGAPSARADHVAVWTGTQMIVNGGDINPNDSSYTSRYTPGTNSWQSGAKEGVRRFNHTAIWTGTEMIVWGGDTGGLSPTNSGGRYDPAANSWTSVSTTGAPAARYFHTAVWTGTEMIVWGGDTGGPSPTGTGARYNPAGNTWSALSTTGAPSARWDHTAVWSGSEMIVWGGHTGFVYLGDGASYDPSTGLWAAVSLGDAPTGRSRHSAVWANTEMIVWGGQYGTQALRTGGRYEPATGTWVPTSTMATIPSPRWHHTGVWTGAELIFWGGEDQAAALASGGRYLPSTGSWVATSTTGAPTARTVHSAVWTGTEMIIWGGGVAPNGVNSQVNTGARYSPASDTWTATTTTNAPVARAYHTAIWTGTEMIVWGGGNYGNIWRNTGGRYRPDTDQWLPTSLGTDCPSPRDSHSAVWTGNEMIIWGGYNGATDVDTGSRYDPAVDSWTALPTTGVPASRWNHRAVWTGTQMIVWGGTHYQNDTQVDTGGRYSPATNAWSSMAASGTSAAARAGHSAVWTGSRMIVWGGQNAGVALATGGLYDPVANSWAPTSTGANVPTARSGHSVAWAGSLDGRMFVWGGSPGTASGGSYCALTCSVSPPADASALSMDDTGGLSQISWTALAGATGYDLVRGDLADLRSGGGGFALATGGCLANNISGTTVTDGDVPGEGTGFWYVERGRNCGGAGTYNSGIASTPPEDRDPGIEASGVGCP